MKSKRFGLVGSALVGACLSFGMALPAHADWFDWSYEDLQKNTIGNGQLQTGLDDNGALIVTTINGTWGDLTIGSLSEAEPAGNDNKYYLPPALAFLDGSGLSFTTSSGDLVNLKYLGPLDSYSAVIHGATSTTTITGTFKDAAAVPVPGPIVGAGLPGLILACGGFLAWACRRKTAQFAA